MLATGRRSAKTKPGKATRKTERERATERGFNLAPKVRADRDDVRLESEVTQGVGTIKRDRRSYLAKQERRGEITRRQCQAGERYASHYEHATAGVPSALDPARVEAHSGGSGSRGLAPLSADPFARLLLDQATRAIGWALAEVVVWVAVEGRAATEWAQHHGRPSRDGMAILRFALDALANHYRRRGDARDDA